MATPGKSKGIIIDSLTNTQVGSTLLHELAEGLYGWDEVIREYVQNAVDSHLEWVEEEGQQPEEAIQIEVRADRISIVDFGAGMDLERAKAVKAIGITSKLDAKGTSNTPFAGYKGVGIWAGLSFFERLTINTTKRGVAEGYQIRIDFTKIVKSIAPNIDIFTVINSGYEIEAYEASVESHGTTITLERPTKSKDNFLNPDEVLSRVSALCPCEIDPQFPHRESLINWYKSNNISYYPLTLNGKSIYKNFPYPIYDEMKPPTGSFVTGHITVNDKIVAEYWHAVHRKNQMIRAKNGANPGFRIVLNGFVLGPTNLYGEKTRTGYEVLNTAEYTDWYVGEIHVTWDALKPNLKRSEFQESQETKTFVDKLRDWYKTLVQQTRDLSDRRTVQDAHTQLAEQITKLEESLGKRPLTPTQVIKLGKLSADLTKLDEEHTKLHNDRRTSVKAKEFNHLKQDRLRLHTSITKLEQASTHNLFETESDVTTKSNSLNNGTPGVNFADEDSNASPINTENLVFPPDVTSSLEQIKSNNNNTDVVVESESNSQNDVTDISNADVFVISSDGEMLLTQVPDTRTIIDSAVAIVDEVLSEQLQGDERLRLSIVETIERRLSELF